MGERLTMDELRSQVRARAPLVTRLQRCMTLVGAIASGRDMRMTVPPRADDDDIFLSVTLADAVEALEGSAGSAVMQGMGGGEKG